MEHRAQKLAVQREAEPVSSEPQIFRNVRIYIDGYLNGTTDIEMRRIALNAGAEVL